MYRKLQFEREKMERWNKLQQRIDTVQQRRVRRLDELQRRLDDEEKDMTVENTILMAAQDTVEESFESQKENMDLSSQDTNIIPLESDCTGMKGTY